MVTRKKRNPAAKAWSAAFWPTEGIAVVAHEIEAQSHDAGQRKRLQLGISHIVMDDTDCLEAARVALHRVEKNGDVSPIAAELHQQRTIYAMPIKDCAVLLACAGLLGPRLVALVAREREANGIDDMGVAIENARRFHVRS